MKKVLRLRNKIRERLPAPDYERIISQMESVTPTLRQVVAEAGVPPKWVHFPVSAVLSSMVVLVNGESVEGSMFGNEGMDGLYLLSKALVNP